MNVKNYAKKALSFVLVLCMLVGIVPWSVVALAAGETALDYAIFASDVHTDADDLKEVMSVIGTGNVVGKTTSGAGIVASSVNLLGDTMLPMATAKNNITTGLGYTTNVTYVYASKHDNPSVDKDAVGCDIHTAWDFSGVAYENDYYIVYNIRESDIADGSKTYASAVAAFESWAAKNDGSKPIFVATHRPFHERRDENDYADYWFEAINEAAKTKDIVVFWAHNHYQESASEDRSVYYVAKGGSFKVWNGKQGVTKTTNFTYMNAGYINANDTVYGNYDVGRRYMASTVAFYEDEMVFQDYYYNSSSDYGAYTGEYAHNVTIKYDHANAKAPVEPTTLTDSATGVSVTGVFAENTGLTVGTVPTVSALSDLSKYKAYQAYDITFTAEGTVSVSIPVPADYPVGNVVVYYVNGSELTDMNATVVGTGENRVATFATDHNSTYAVVYAAEPAAGGGTATSIEQATSLEQGVPYIIVCDRSGAVLTGTASGNDLQLSGTASVETKDLWYYNGKNLIYGDPNSTDKYLLVSDGAASIGSKNGNKTVTNVFLNKDGKTFSIGTAERQYLNQYGGQSSAIAAGYRIDGNSDDGSKWRIYKLVGGSGTSGPSVISYDISGDGVGYVMQYATASTVVKNAQGETITITINYSDGTSSTANLTVGMINGAQTTTPGRFDNLTVSYKNNPLTESFTLNVRKKILSDYPDYPDEGAVKVNKTSTGHFFQDTGISEVELSTSGVPMKKGVDVIIMLDTSSSMKNNSITENGVTKTREEILEDSLANLIAKFKQPAEDGEPHDIRVAIGDFNGYFRNTGTPYDVDSDDKVRQDNGNQNPNVEVFTSTTNALDETAFLHVSDLENSYDVTTTSGTNYDYAFDAIYQLGAAIQDDNKKKGEDRDLYVIFMSDGTPFQWNYYTSQRDTADWNKWLTGSYKTQAEVEAAIRTNGATYCTDHAYYYNLQDTNNDGAFNEHRMANAIKGNKESYFEVIRKTTAGISTERLQDTGTKTDNLYTVPGLGAKMFSIGFAISSENKIELSTVQHAIKVTASEQTGSTQYYYEAKNATELDHAFDVIGAEITYAAYNARYVDMMGERFNLQMSHTISTINVDGDPVKRVLDDYDITPAITVKTYTIWTRQEAEAGKCSYAQVGQRKDIAPTVLERVEFSADGKEAYSSLNGVDAKGNINNTVNIIKDGVICAKTFWYNTNTVGALVDFDGDGAMNDMLDADGGGVRDDLLPAETFYWKVGTVQAKELAISYFVYLAGSLEGEAQAGSYATNQSAILYYDNYLGHACKKEVASPVMAWKAASVKYAFYLVNDKGEVVVNQTTGETGTFANRIAVTQPVLHSEILLNNLTQVNSINVASDTVLPEGYTLYDSNVTYTIVILSGSGGGSWNVAKSAGKADATYVTGYKGSSYTNVAESSGNSYDYTNTTVWFAVLWQRQTVPDTVVVDFGLPVDIGVLVNDMFGSDGALAGIAPDGSKPANIANNGYTGGLSGVFGTSVETTIANVSINSDEVRYAPKTANGMNFATVEKFDYAVLYSGDYNAGYYYGDVTVIPATTIYYEENFVSFNNSSAASGNMGVWSDIGDADENATQDEDRAGLYNVHEIDANNVYGYDSAYRAYTTYSNGGAKIITVDSATGAKKTAPTATFTFTGTGFDIIALTDNDSGAITVTAIGENGGTYRKSVNNYYGYSYVDGKWVVDTSRNDTIWQVPVLKFEGMAFDTYTVTISVAYTKSADMNYVEDGTDNSYNFVLDAIRIYDPINVNTQLDSTEFPTIKDVYVADKEADPDYIVIKDIILNPDNITTSGSINGAVFIDGLKETSNPSLYSNPGPNNETYLAYGQSVAFKLVANAEPKALQLGVKLAQGDSATVSLNNGAKTRNFTTASDMYYTLPIDWVKDDATGLYFANVSLANDTQGAIVSLTNLKLIGAEFTFSATPMPASEYSLRSSDIQVSIVCDPEFVETTTMDMLRAYSDDLNAAGDINGDGAVNAIDSNIMNRAVAGVVSLDMVQKIAADVDESNKINGIDSNLLVRKVAGKN